MSTRGYSTRGVVGVKGVVGKGVWGIGPPGPGITGYCIPGVSTRGCCWYFHVSSLNPYTPYPPPCTHPILIPPDYGGEFHHSLKEDGCVPL